MQHHLRILDSMMMTFAWHIRMEPMLLDGQNAYLQTCIWLPADVQCVQYYPEKEDVAVRYTAWLRCFFISLWKSLAGDKQIELGHDVGRISQNFACLSHFSNRTVAMPQSLCPLIHHSVSWIPVLLYFQSPPAWIKYKGMLLSLCWVNTGLAT